MIYYCHMLRWRHYQQYGSMLAIIFVLAPGAGCVRAIIGAFHRYEGDFNANESTIWESVVMEGVTYAVGFYLAFDILAPIVPFCGRRKPPEWQRETTDTREKSKPCSKDQENAQC